MTFGVEGPPGNVEKLWVRQVGPRQYKVMNVPVLAFGVSVDDVVTGDVVKGRLTFGSVVRPGGHSTYRIMLSAGDMGGRAAVLWRRLKDFGCNYESATARFIAMDVPPSADIYNVYALLEEGEAEGIWTFEEGHCGHPLKRRPDFSAPGETVE